MKYKKIKKLITISLSCFCLFLNSSLKVNAEIDYNAEAEARKLLPIQSNNIQEWPQGPALGAQSAILMELETGTILYSKNMDEKLYPASTTKILTCLLAAEMAEMNEVVTFSNEAVFSIESGSSNMGMDVDEQITMEQALYGVLVGSANEAANAVAEHISGSVSEFSSIMNKKAQELGCKNSNFINPNGLYNENHYTTAFDLATIARSFFSNDLLCKMSSTVTYEIPQTMKQPDDIIIHSKNKLLPGRECSYDYIVGSKTGYTSEARQTLVSCARKDGMTLVCVIMKEESPEQFNDTITLFDYGFQNFQKINIAENEKDFSVSTTDFFESDSTVFGNSSSILKIDPDAFVVLPTNVTFDETLSTLEYEDENTQKVASIKYTYQDVPVGNASVSFISPVDDSDSKPISSPAITEETLVDDNDSVLFLNVTKILFIIIISSGLLISIFVIHSLINNYQFSKSRKQRKRKKNYIPSQFQDYDF